MAEAERRVESVEPLTQAATILQHSHAVNPERYAASDYHMLVAAMTFYAAGHYSRAFVLVRKLEPRTPVAGLIAAFLRKDFNLLLSRVNEVMLGSGFSDSDVVELVETEQLDERSAVDRSLTSFTASGLACWLEYIFSGRGELIQQAREVFIDTMELARAAEDPAWWWIARLLILMLDDFASASPWIPPATLSDELTGTAPALPPVVTVLEAADLRTLGIAACCIANRA